MYFCRMQVRRHFDLVASRTSSVISSRSFDTEIPTPRLVFSPGFMIQAFGGYPFSNFSLNF
jgi:hypothetical protein